MSQYELVFTQLTDGSSINHKNIKLPETNFKVKREFEPKSNIVYKEIDGEATRRAQFKKEQLEFEKKERNRMYDESLNIVKNTEAVLTKKFSILDKFVTV